MSNLDEGTDAGFTLIEILVVLVILPLLMGAVAAAFIVSVKDDTTVSATLSDSENAQLSSAYFSRDIQVATETTTKAALALGNGTFFSSVSPQVCATQSVLSANAVPAGETLLVALYRSAAGSAPALDVAYWLEGSGSSTQITRYSCTLSATYSASSPLAVVISDNATNPNSPTKRIASGPISAAVTISPSQIGTASASGWTYSNPVIDYTGSSSQALGGGAVNLTVLSTSGFTSGNITITSTDGLQTISCTGVTSTQFQGCTGGAGTVVPGAAIHQASITSVLATVTEPSSSYTYVLEGAPAGNATGTTNCLGGNCPSPGLLVLGGNGISLNGTGSVTCSVDGSKSKICVNGSVVIDSGTANCNGNAAIGSSGPVSSVTPGSTCNGGAVATTPLVPDPIAGSLPSPCFTTSPSLTTNPPENGGHLVPGIYTPLDTNLTGDVTMEPGVYVFEAGIPSSVSSISLATASTTDKYFYSPPTSTTGAYDSSAGLLMYLPGNGYPSGCINETSPGGVTLSTGTSVTVSPLDASQSEYWFGSPYLADMWIWQDITDTQAFSLSSNVNVTSAGLAYLPGAALVTANGNASITTGRMIVGGVQLGGTPSITLTGS